MTYTAMLEALQNSPRGVTGTKQDAPATQSLVLHAVLLDGFQNIRLKLPECESNTRPWHKMPLLGTC